MDDNTGRVLGDDGFGDLEPPLEPSDDVTVGGSDLTGPGGLDLYSEHSHLSESQTLEEETELFATDPSCFGDLPASGIDVSHPLYEESQHTLGSSPLDNISGSDLSPSSSSLYLRQLDSSSPLHNLPAVDPSAILSPERAGRGYPTFPILQPTKRGPGRPRKDGLSPIPRKRSGRARVFGSGRGSRSFSGERAPRSRGSGRRGRPSSSSVHSLSYRRALQNQAAQFSPERVGRPSSLERVGRPPSLLRSFASTQRMDPLDSAFEPKPATSTVSSSLEVRLSEVPSTVPDEPLEQGPVHLCAFCGCGERSLLGQGELTRYDPTPGFNPFKRVLQRLRKGGSEYDEKGKDKGTKHLTWRRKRGPPKEGRERSRSPRQSSLDDESLQNQTGDELSQVGFAEDVEISNVYEPSGHVWAHDSCAEWSEGVSPTEDHLQFVDRAVLHGLTQKCSYCGKYGATISCRGPRCQKQYHFPCASAGGCFQEMRSRSLLCPDHLDQAETLSGSDSLCVQCGSTGKVNEQLFCTTCGHHYHGECLCPPVEVKPTVRAGWQCPNCKICQTCRHPGNDCKMLVCDLCDKGYHTFCLKPAMTTIPKNGWKCKNCRICTDCGARTPGNGPSSRWHLNYSVCDSCYQQRNKGLCCPLCGKAYRHFDNKQMVQCNSCKKYVHSDCDPSIDGALLARLRETGTTDYNCTVCRAQEDTEYNPFSLPPSLTTEESLDSCPPSRDPDYGLKDDPYLNEASLTAASSQESLYCDDSSSSMDVDSYTGEKVSTLTSPSGHLASYMQAKVEMLESHRGKLPVGRKRIGAGRPRTRPLVPEKKREKRRGPKTKIKPGQLGSLGHVSGASSRVETDSSKDDSGDDHPATIVLTGSKDTFALEQDICKSCGAFGDGDEGRLIGCTQCGQCYHPYCANVKVTKVILQKGWRCLDCTVCEGCGSPKDEGRLLLCDECDISYHTYCLEPPLEHVPKGTWKCKWCVCCQNCGTTTPGFGCMWQNNYNQCGPCSSKVVCPACRMRYREEELIIQCVQCDRWLHAFCDGLKCEDDAERAADYGYHCLFCRPKTGHPGPLPPPPPPPPPPLEDKDLLRTLSPPPLPREPDVPKQFLMDGVYLSATGIQQIQSLTVPMPKKTRARRGMGRRGGIGTPPDPHSKHPHVARLLSMSMDGEETMDKDPDESQTPEPMENMEPPLSVAAAHMDMEGGEVEGEQGKKRRQRKQTGLGVGGFIPRQRGTRTWKRQTSQTDITPEERAGTSREGMEGAVILGPDGLPIAPVEKVRKRRRPRVKSQLEENFPAYLQEAFFGRPLLDVSKDSKQTIQQMDSDPEKEKLGVLSPPPGLGDSSNVNKEEKDDLASLMGTGTDDDMAGLNEGDLKDILPPDLSDLPHDEDILNMLGNEDGLRIDSETDTGGEVAEGSRKDLDMDSMLDDKNLDSMLNEVVVPSLTQIDSKTVEDVFKGVLSSDTPTDPTPATVGNPFPIGMNQGGIPGHPLQHLPPQLGGMGPGPSHQQHQQQHGPLPGPSHLINTSQGPPPLQLPHDPNIVLPPMQSPTDPDVMPPQPGMAPYGMPPYGHQQMSPTFNPGPNPAWALPDDDQQEPTSRRNILKWENDEALGLNATISAVLYVNTNHPNLKTDYPEWSERSKQIAKLWKKLTPEEKAPFLAKARKNRTSSRVQKAQKQVSQELQRRQQEARQRHDIMSMPPPPAPPPLPSPGSQGPGMGDPFLMSPQQNSPGGMDPGRRPDLMSPMMSPRHPGMQSPGRSMDGHSPLQSPHGPMPRPPWAGDDQFPKPMGTPAGPMAGRPGEAVGRPPADPYAFQPGTPMPSDQFPDGQRPLSHPPRPPVSQPYDPYAQQPGTPRAAPMEEDPYAKMPGTPGIPQSRPYDPYARQPMTPHPAATSTADSFKPPSTPRPAGPDQFPGGPRPGVMDHFQRPRLPMPLSPGGSGPRGPGDQMRFHPPPPPDPYAFPPGTPRPVPGSEDQYFHPQRPLMKQQQLSPRMRHPSPDQFQQVGQQPPTSTDPYAQQPMTPHPGMPQSPQGAHSPHSTPGPLRHPDQPFPVRPPQQQLHRSQSLPDAYNQPGTPQSDMAKARALAAQLSPGGSMSHIRGPRPPFMQEKPVHPESVMLQQLYRRRHPHFAAGSWPSSLSHALLGPGGETMDLGERGSQHQQLREILAQQILKQKMRKQQEESEKMKGPQWPPQDGVPQSIPGTQGVPPQFGMEGGPRPPPGFTEQTGPMGPHQERWAALRHRMIRPPNPTQFGPGEQFAARSHMELQSFPGQVRQARPPLPGMPHQGFPPGAEGPRMGSPGHFPPTSLHGQTPGMPPGPLHHPRTMGGSPNPNFPGPRMPAPESTQMMPPFARQTSQPGTGQSEEELFRETPLTSARDPMISENNLKSSSGENLAGLASQSEHLALSDIELKVSKQSMSSEDEKHEDDDLLSADGTFDILKFADPELGSDDDKFFDEQLDLIEGKPEDTKPDQTPKVEGGASTSQATPEAGAEEKGDGSGKEDSQDSKTTTSDFQSKFLEFNMKRQEQLAIDAARLAKDGKKGEDKKPPGLKTGVSHIAALLQGTEPIGTRLEKSEIEKRLQAGVKIAEEGKPQTDPLGLGHRVGMGPGMSPLHHGRSPHQGPLTPVHMSPSGNMAPGTPGLPSPKFMPSPRSGQPSPRTPSVHSPFSQMPGGPVHSPHSQPVTPGASQLSPFSTQVSSPFSPPVSSQSSFGSGIGSTPQSPFQQGPQPRPGLPQGQSFPPGTPQAMLNQPQAPGQQFPMHHSPRATMTPTNQYTQGTYGQQLNNMPPRGGTLTPTPSSILYGQSVASQHGIRNPGPRLPLHQPGMMPGEEGQMDPNRLQGQDNQPGMPGHPPTSISQSETAAEIAKLLNQGSLQSFTGGPRPGLPIQSTHPNLQQQLAHGHPSMGPRGMPQGFGGPGQQRMSHPGMRMPARMPGFPGGPGGPGLLRPGQMPPPHHKEQTTLLDELLEQEKQEQKRQAEQQALIHRREMVGKPEGMMGPNIRPGLGIPPRGPRMEHPRMPGPGQEGGWPGPQGGPGNMAGSPGFPGFGPRSQGQLSPRTPSPFQATSPGMQPPQMSPLTMIPPPPQPPMPSPGGEMGPEYDRQQLQYEDWLTKQNQFMDMQIKLLEQQIAKQKRTKKSIQARQRQARKNGNEVNPNDVVELERITTEQSALQKQLEALRKQHRQHQMMVQDYRTKQKEQMERAWLPSPAPPQGMMSPQSGQPSPVSTPSLGMPPSPVASQSNTPPQTSQVRTNTSNSVRLTRTDRQEYEAYMQNRLRMMSQQQGTPGIPLTGPRIRLPVPGQIPPGQGPPGQPPPGQLPPGQMPPGGLPAGQVPPGQIPPGGMPPGQGPPVGPGPQTSAAPGGPVDAARLTTVMGIPFQDNNPFSEDFQQREQLERFREKNRSVEGGLKPPAATPTETDLTATTPTAPAEGVGQTIPPQPPAPTPTQQPGPPQNMPGLQYFRERGMAFDQGPRFPRAPGMFTGDGAPRPFEGPRPPAYPGPPGPPGPPGMYPPVPGADQSRLPFPPGMPFQPGFGIPPTANLPPEMGSQSEKEKPKKRRKKKKAAESDNAQSQPLPPSMPTQATALGSGAPTAATVAPAVTIAPPTVAQQPPQTPAPVPPKVTEFPIKPQSETDRRILEILSNTAALAQKEGDEQTPGGKGVRGKSPASAPSPLPTPPPPAMGIPPAPVSQAAQLAQIPTGSQMPPGAQMPAVSQMPPGAPIPPGSQIPPGAQMQPGSQMPPGAQIPPGSQMPPGTQMQSGAQGLHGAQVPTASQLSHIPPGTQPPPGSGPPSSQMMQGMQMPPGSQTPPGVPMPSGTHGPHGSQVPITQVQSGAQPPTDASQVTPGAQLPTVSQMPPHVSEAQAIPTSQPQILPSPGPKETPSQLPEEKADEGSTPPMTKSEVTETSQLPSGTQTIEKPVLESSSSIPHLETQLSQGSGQGSQTYESPPHLQPQTDVPPQETSSAPPQTTTQEQPASQPTTQASTPPSDPQSGTSPATTGPAPAASEAQPPPASESSSKKDQPVKPSDEAYDEPDGGASGEAPAEPKKKFVCDDGIHCGTDDEDEDPPAGTNQPPSEQAPAVQAPAPGSELPESSQSKPEEKDESNATTKAKFVCDDGIHCGTDDEDEEPTGDADAKQTSTEQVTSSSDQTQTSETITTAASIQSDPQMSTPEALTTAVPSEGNQQTEEEQKSSEANQSQTNVPVTSQPSDSEVIKSEATIVSTSGGTIDPAQTAVPTTAQSEIVPTSSSSDPQMTAVASEQPPATGSGAVQVPTSQPVTSVEQRLLQQQLTMSTPLQHPPMPGVPRPPGPQGHPMFRHLTPASQAQMMAEHMMGARAPLHVQSSHPEATVSDASVAQTQRLPPSYAAAIMSAHGAGNLPVTASDSPQPMPKISTSSGSESSAQNIPTSSQPQRTQISQLLQSSIAQSVSLPGSMMTLSSTGPPSAAPRLSHPAAPTSVTFSNNAPTPGGAPGQVPHQGPPFPTPQMGDPRLRMSAAALQHHAAQMARMQGLHRMPGMMQQRMPPHGQPMGQRMPPHSSPQGTPQQLPPSSQPNTSPQGIPHSASQVLPPLSSPDGLPQGPHPAHHQVLQGFPGGQGPPHHGMPGQPPHSSAQPMPPQAHSMQGMQPRSTAPGMPPRSAAPGMPPQGMHPHFGQRGMPPQAMLQRMAHGGPPGMPHHIMQRMRMAGQRLPPHGMPHGMPHPMQQGMPGQHPGMQGVQQHPGMPHPSQGMPPHSVAHGMPPHSAAPGMPPHSTAPGMPPHSTAIGMPPHSTAMGMPPHSTAPGMPPHSTAPGMPHHSLPGMPAHSEAPVLPPHPTGHGLPPQSTAPGLPPHGVPQHTSPQGIPLHMSQRNTPPHGMPPGAMPPHSAGVMIPKTSPGEMGPGLLGHPLSHPRPPHPMPLQIPGQPRPPHPMQGVPPSAQSPLNLLAKQIPPISSPGSATSPRPGSALATPPQSTTPATTPLSSSPASSLSALAALSPHDGIKIKQEPTDDHSTGDTPELSSEESALTASQNALLKQLLATSGGKAGALINPQDDDIPQLTPEQQQQLEMIDKMPIFRETEISSEEWESKTPEEREKILEMRRQEYERKRKEYEELRKAKRKTTPPEGAVPGTTGEVVKIKRRKKGEAKDGTQKRIRKPKAKETEIEGRAESFLQQLRALPPINLQEPAIGININIVPVMAANTLTVENQLRGGYGKAFIDGLADMYGNLLHPNFPMGIRPPAAEIAARRRFLSDGQHMPFTGPITDEQRYHLLSAGVSPQALGQGLGHRMPLLPGMMRPFLPPPPRIEPHLEPTNRDTPDTVISSSSPEVGFGDQDSELPALRPIDPAEVDNDRGTSPAIPLLQPVPIKPEPKDISLKKEEEPTKMMDSSELSLDAKKDAAALISDQAKAKNMSALTSTLARPFMGPSLDQQVSVTLTLSATAAEDIGGVISAIADLLKIAVPPTYEMTRSPSPESFKMNLTHKEEAVNISSLIKAKPKFCRHCDVVVLSSGIRKKKTELPFLMKEEQDSEDEEVTFCSMNCYMQFTVTHQVPPPTADEAGNLVEHKSGTPSTSPRHVPVTSALSISTTPPITPQTKDQPATPTTPLSSSTVSKSPMPSPMLPSPPVKFKEEKAGKKHRRSSSTTSDVQMPQFQPVKPLVKKWKDIRYQRWDPKILDNLGRLSPVPTKETDSIWKRLDMILYAAEDVEDSRKCTLCLEGGDGLTDSASRLLNMDVDKWVHLNCALWSYEVYETLNGALMNVDVAIKRGSSIECALCGKLGATISCFKVRCTNTYHLPCAKKLRSMFFQDKTLLCPVHAPKGPTENVLESLVVFRRVYINRDEDKQIASMIHQDEGAHTLRVGALVLHSIGQLLPHQIQTGRFHNKDYIFPVGFRTSRFYWSMRQLYKRCRYICSISDNDGRPEFSIKIKEQGFDDLVVKEDSAKDAWRHILSPLEKIRKGSDLVKMFPNCITGEELFGLTEPNILKVIESLPGTDLLGNYCFRYGRSPLIEMPLAINPTGCARTEPKLRTHFKRRPHTLQSSNSRSLPTTVTGVTSDVNSPYMKQFVHSKSQQYRRLKTEWKTNVFLARSGIQGLGLFTARDLDKHTMVIEYIGDLIRNEVANRRETVYEEQNRGVYMFRIDSDTVIDATMAGGPARYINHSCAPNCVAEVVPFEKESKIIIITSRRLAKGEELTYDYKFDFEDESHKIPCNCGAGCCRKWMN